MYIILKFPIFQHFMILNYVMNNWALSQFQQSIRFKQLLEFKDENISVITERNTYFWFLKKMLNISTN